ncbi:ABC transporter ATP-binding protein [Candidatus Pacearchaeota archaeon]|nr:ABC transporter ATP-binding protein [Candidatus Pacearchaeota archaeon]
MKVGLAELLKNKPKYSTIDFGKDLWYFLKKYKGKFIFFTVLLAISSALGLIPAIILSKIIDFFTKYSAGQSTTIFYWYLGALAAIMIVSTILRLRSKYFFGGLTNDLQKDAKVDSFKKLMEGDLIWHDKENTGNKMQKINEGISSLGSFMDLYINRGVDMVITLIGILIILTYLDWKYFFIALAFMFCYLSVEITLNKKIAKKTLEVQIAKEKASGKAYEYSSNIATVKSLGIEKSLNNQIALQEEEILNVKTSRRKINNFKWITIQLISAFFYVLFIFFVGKDILIGILTIGSIVIYIEYIRRMQSVLNDISNNLEKIIEIKYSLYRMTEIYRSIPTYDEANAKELKNWSKITIKDVGFKYKNEEVLDNFNLVIHRGERIGIVGKSGSGKSTLFKLLLKLYLPQTGMIYFDSTPVVGLKKDSIVDKISIVPQETELFNITFKDNILLSVPGNKNYKKYSQALKISQCIPIIRKLKYKDMTLVGEKGVRLSGGEKQRLGIARALYKDSDIIVFDESTSNLDYETEKKIQTAFDKELKDKTLIISAHRLSTLRNMDRIIVINNGQISEQGTYDKLVAQKGEFYNLLKKQEN